jgi:hypothetical protein
MRNANLTAWLTGLVLAWWAPAALANHSQLLGQWHLDNDPAVSESTPDSSGHGLTAFFARFDSTTAGRFGAAFDFHGSTPTPTVSPATLLEPQRVTVAAWVRQTGRLLPGTVRYVAAKGAQDCTAASWGLYTGTAAGDGLRFYVFDGTNAHVSAPAGTGVWDGAWHAVAGTFDGAKVRLYVDGTEVGSGQPASAPIAYGLANRDFVIASYPDATCPGTLSGQAVDEVRVYNRALTAAEIRLLHDPAAGAPPVVPEPSAGGGGGGGRPVPRAAFALAKTTVRPGEHARFDASASRVAGVRISSFAWDVTGDGRSDVECGGHAPILDARLSGNGTRQATLTVTDSLGRSVSAARALTLSGPTVRPRLPERLPPRVKRRLGRLELTRSSVFRCLADPASSRVDVTANAGPPPGCNTEVVSASLKAIGCLVPTTLDQLRGDEQRLLEASTRPAFGSSARVARTAISRQQALKIATYAYDDALYVADGPVRINGLDFVPRGANRIVISLAGTFVIARSAVVSHAADVVANSPVGRFGLAGGELSKRLAVSPGRELVPGLRLPGAARLVPGLGIQGDVRATIARYALNLDVQTVLPKVLGSVTAGARLRATTTDGVLVDGLSVRAPRVPLGFITVKDLRLTFERVAANGARNRLAGGVTVTLPPQGTGVRGELEFVDGRFNRLYVQYEGPPDIVFAPLVHMTRLGGGFTIDPPSIFGTTTLNVGPNPGGGCPKLGIDGSASISFDYPVRFTAEGTTRFLCLGLMQLRTYFDETGYAEVSGRFNPDLSPLPITIDASGRGRLQLPLFGRSFAMQVDVNGRGCLRLSSSIKGCVGARFVASDRAMGVCGDFGFIEAGLGFVYPPAWVLANPVVFAGWLIADGNIKLMLGSCRVSPFFSRSFATASQAGPPTFSVKRGETAAVIGLVGDGAPPRAVVRGPSGRTIDIPDGELLRTGHEVAFRMDFDDTAYVMIDKPEPGVWTIEPKPGSVRITAIRQATELPAPQVSGRVRRAGGKLALSYRVKPAPGRSVRFFERVTPQGGQLIGTARASGIIRFTPADAAGRRREVVAQILNGGVPSETVKVASFRSGPPRIGRPRAVRARRRGRALVIAWRAAANATAYRVNVRLTDGRRLLLVPTGRRRSVTIGRVRRGTGATARVVGQRPGPRFGPAARVVFGRR